MEEIKAGMRRKNAGNEVGIMRELGRIRREQGRNKEGIKKGIRRE